MARNQIIAHRTTGLCRPVGTTNQLSVDEYIVSVDRLPNCRTERMDKGVFRPANDAEIAEYDASAATALDAEAGAKFNNDRALKAVLLTVAELTGKTPKQVTDLAKAKYRSVG